MDETCHGGYHFWEDDSEVCQCGAFEWIKDPLAWPAPVTQDEEKE